MFRCFLNYTAPFSCFLVFEQHTRAPGNLPGARVFYTVLFFDGHLNACAVRSIIPVHLTPVVRGVGNDRTGAKNVFCFKNHDFYFGFLVTHDYTSSFSRAALAARS